MWLEVEKMLEVAPGLEAKTIFERLLERPEGTFTEGQLRTLQRKIRRWRAEHGPQKEVMFPQEHRPGEYAQSDYTSMNVDPTDDCTFWYVNEYYQTTEPPPDRNWQTRIASFKLPGC